MSQLRLIERRTAAILLAGTLALCPPTFSQELRLLPVSTHVELKDRLTDLRLEIPWKAYGYPEPGLDAFGALPEQDAAEQTFAALMLALRDNADPADVRIMQNNAALSVDDLPPVLNLWRRAFGEYKSVTVIGRSAFEDLDFFFWALPTERGPYPRAFAITRGPSGFKATLVSSNQPVAALILDSIENTRIMEPQKAGKLNLAMHLPLDDSEQQVRLLFGGQRTDFDVLAAPLDDAPSPAMCFHAESWRLLVRVKATRLLHVSPKEAPRRCAKPWQGMERAPFS